MENEIACKAQVRGRVTGVGFRYCALDFAARLPGLKGYVKNVGHGHVEAFVQGSPADVRSMLDWLRRGPPGAQVDSVEVVDAAPDKGMGEFTIRETWRA